MQVTNGPWRSCEVEFIRQTSVRQIIGMPVITSPRSNEPKYLS